MSVTPNSCSCRLAVPIGIHEGEKQPHLSSLSSQLTHTSLGEDRKIAAHVPQRRAQIMRVQGDVGNQTRLGQLDLRAQPESEARLSQSASCVLEQHDMRIEGNVRVRPRQLLTAQSHGTQEL